MTQASVNGKNYWDNRGISTSKMVITDYRISRSDYYGKGDILWKPTISNPNTLSEGIKGIGGAGYSVNMAKDGFPFSYDWYTAGPTNSNAWIFYGISYESRLGQANNEEHSNKPDLNIRCEFDISAIEEFGLGIGDDALVGYYCAAAPMSPFGDLGRGYIVYGIWIENNKLYTGLLRLKDFQASPLVYEKIRFKEITGLFDISEGFSGYATISSNSFLSNEFEKPFVQDENGYGFSLCVKDSSGKWFYFEDSYQFRVGESPASNLGNLQGWSKVFGSIYLHEGSRFSDRFSCPITIKSISFPPRVITKIDDTDKRIDFSDFPNTFTTYKKTLSLNHGEIVADGRLEIILPHNYFIADNPGPESFKISYQEYGDARNTDQESIGENVDTFTLFGSKPVDRVGDCFDLVIPYLNVKTRSVRYDGYDADFLNPNWDLSYNADNYFPARYDGYQSTIKGGIKLIIDDDLSTDSPNSLTEIEVVKAGEISNNKAEKFDDGIEVKTRVADFNPDTLEKTYKEESQDNRSVLFTEKFNLLKFLNLELPFGSDEKIWDYKIDVDDKNELIHGVAISFVEKVVATGVIYSKNRFHFKLYYFKVDRTTGSITEFTNIDSEIGKSSYWNWPSLDYALDYTETVGDIEDVRDDFRIGTEPQINPMFDLFDFPVRCLYDEERDVFSIFTIEPLREFSNYNITRIEYDGSDFVYTVARIGDQELDDLYFKNLKSNLHITNFNADLLDPKSMPVFGIRQRTALSYMEMKYYLYSFDVQKKNENNYVVVFSLGYGASDTDSRNNKFLPIPSSFILSKEVPIEDFKTFLGGPNGLTSRDILKSGKNSIRKIYPYKGVELSTFSGFGKLKLSKKNSKYILTVLDLFSASEYVGSTAGFNYTRSTGNMIVLAGSNDLNFKRIYIPYHVKSLYRKNRGVITAPDKALDGSGDPITRGHPIWLHRDLNYFPSKGIDILQVLRMGQRITDGDARVGENGFLYVFYTVGGSLYCHKVSPEYLETPPSWIEGNTTAVRVEEFSSSVATKIKEQTDLLIYEDSKKKFPSPIDNKGGIEYILIASEREYGEDLGSPTNVYGAGSGNYFLKNYLFSNNNEALYYLYKGDMYSLTSIESFEYKGIISVKSISTYKGSKDFVSDGKQELDEFDNPQYVEYVKAFDDLSSPNSIIIGEVSYQSNYPVKTGQRKGWVNTFIPRKYCSNLSVISSSTAIEDGLGEFIYSPYVYRYGTTVDGFAPGVSHPNFNNLVTFYDDRVKIENYNYTFPSVLPGYPDQPVFEVLLSLDSNYNSGYSSYYNAFAKGGAIKLKAGFSFDDSGQITLEFLSNPSGLEDNLKPWASNIKIVSEIVYPGFPNLPYVEVEGINIGEIEELDVSNSIVNLEVYISPISKVGSNFKTKYEVYAWLGEPSLLKDSGVNKILIKSVESTIPSSDPILQGFASLGLPLARVLEALFTYRSNFWFKLYGEPFITWNLFQFDAGVEDDYEFYKGDGEYNIVGQRCFRPGQTIYTQNGLAFRASKGAAEVGHKYGLVNRSFYHSNNSTYFNTGIPFRSSTNGNYLSSPKIGDLDEENLLISSSKIVFYPSNANQDKSIYKFEPNNQSSLSLINTNVKEVIIGNREYPNEIDLSINPEYSEYYKDGVLSNYTGKIFTSLKYQLRCLSASSASENIYESYTKGYKDSDIVLYFDSEDLSIEGDRLVVFYNEGTKNIFELPELSTLPDYLNVYDEFSITFSRSIYVEQIDRRVLAVGLKSSLVKSLEDNEMSGASDYISMLQQIINLSPDMFSYLVFSSNLISELDLSLFEYGTVEMTIPDRLINLERRALLAPGITCSSYTESTDFYIPNMTQEGYYEIGKAVLGKKAGLECSYAGAALTYIFDNESYESLDGTTVTELVSINKEHEISLEIKTKKEYYDLIRLLREISKKKLCVIVDKKNPHVNILARISDSVSIENFNGSYPEEDIVGKNVTIKLVEFYGE